MTLPRRKLWRFFFWIAFAAILLEVLGLTNTFLELHRRNRGSTAGLAPDQIAGVVHLWPIVAEEVEIARMAGGHVSLKGDGAGSFFVNGDRPALSRAISNIIGNALRYGRVAHVSIHGAGETIEVIVDDCGQHSCI